MILFETITHCTISQINLFETITHCTISQMILFAKGVCPNFRMQVV